MYRLSTSMFASLEGRRSKTFGLFKALFLVSWLPINAVAADLKVLKVGLGTGQVTSDDSSISCGIDCDATYASPTTVVLTATAASGSVFSHWEGDGSGTANVVSLNINAHRSVRAVFHLLAPIPPLGDFTPEGIETYLMANPIVNSPGRFIAALPAGFKQNWILMTRSESLQTGTAEFPRILLPSPDARFIFTVGLQLHNSYPGAHPNAIEYMQWDAAEKNFRFHEIVVDAIPALGVPFPARSRGVVIDDTKCSKCHSTRNVLNRGTTPGTTGITPGTVKVKNKPNWDSYDSWGGMLPFNRDRIYQGTVEAAAFRRIFNPWTWRTNGLVREIIEQLELQPPGVPAAHAIIRTNGGSSDGHVNFPFDSSPPVQTEPNPVGSGSISTNYSFNGLAGTGTATAVTQGGEFVTLHHSNIPMSDEGRGVRLFDALGGLAGTLNQQRITDEIISHRFATGSVEIDVRPIALAIVRDWVTIDESANTVTSGVPPLTIDLGFFNARNGMTINALVADTRTRAQNLTRRKADIQKINLDRTDDTYIVDSESGVVQRYGDATSMGVATSLERLRQEVFRRPLDGFAADSTVMGGIYVDREQYVYNTKRIALYRYFLEPLGVSVDKWSMGVRGRSRTYSFADVFGTYADILQPELEASLISDPIPGLSDPDDKAEVIAAINSGFAALPAVDAVPKYTDVQRIFNKSCIECHGGLEYPPYVKYGTGLDLSEDENPPTGMDRLDRSHAIASSYVNATPATSLLYSRITNTSEACPYGLMPCGGPSLSRTDIETIRRWIVGSAPNTRGDPHIKTVDGVNYDFQAAGEYVLLRGENLEIQVRQTAVATDSPLGPNRHTGLTSCVSVNTAVAIQVGSNRVTYQPDLQGRPTPEGLQLRIDGKPIRLEKKEIILGSGGRVIATPAAGGIQVESSGGTVVVVTPGWWDHYQLWYLNIDVRHVRATEGIMGAIAPGNWLPALPDGSLMGPKPVNLAQRYKDLYEKFGNAWRVTDESSLFDYAPGTSTKTFTIETWPNGESPQACVPPPNNFGVIDKPPAKSIPVDEAQKHCRSILAADARGNCEQDVRVTGDPTFAKTYFQSEQLERNRQPLDPMLVFPRDFQIDVSTKEGFVWKNTIDADGEALAYKLCVWDVNELFKLDKCERVPSPVLYAPSHKSDLAMAASVVKLKAGNAYFWKIIAEDGRGGVAESETRRFETR